MRRRWFLSEHNFGLASVPGPSDPARYPAVEEYQITFSCDNLFLLNIMSEITLAERFPKERDETPVSLED